ncbi:hypothetical protein Hanom_Chr16g01473201 [Helianthus anomalus]
MFECFILGYVFCNIVCNMQLPVHPFMMLKDAFTFHTHSRVMPYGMTQYVCGLQLLDQAGFICGIKLIITLLPPTPHMEF